MTEVRVVDKATGGAKGQKEQWLSLVPPRFLGYLSQVYRMGAEKYSRDNYLRGYDWSLSFDALLRHVYAAIDGEWNDEESGLPHLSHAAWHCATLILFHDHGLGTDNRVDFTGQHVAAEGDAREDHPTEEEAAARWVTQSAKELPV